MTNPQVKHAIRAAIIRQLLATTLNPDNGQSRQDAALEEATELSAELTIAAFRGLTESLLQKLESGGVGTRQVLRVWTGCKVWGPCVAGDCSSNLVRSPDNCVADDPLLDDQGVC